MTITIYHNPRCQTSRNVLAYLRDAGHEPHIIEYLKTPPSRSELKRLVKIMGGKTSDIVRWKEPIAGQLGLDRESSSEDELLDAMMEHPILINRPIVATEKAVKLCRPSEAVKALL
jgi:arsenate reductase